MSNVTVKVELDGNFFKRDPGKTLRTNIRNMLDALAPVLDQEVESQIRSHAGDMPFFTGFTAAHVVGYTTSAKTGKRWGTWMAVGLPTTGMNRAEAIRTKAAAATIERRFHPFRSVKSAVYRARPLLTADLTKGLE